MSMHRTGIHLTGGTSSKPDPDKISIEGVPDIQTASLLI
jgi:hypothetical protein